MIWMSILLTDGRRNIRFALGVLPEQQAALRELGEAADPTVSVGGLFDAVGATVETKSGQV